MTKSIPAEEQFDAVDGLGTLFGIGLESEVGEQPARYCRADCPAELLAHRRGTEDKSCSAVSAAQFRIVGTVGIHRPQERKDASGTDADEALEDEYPYQVAAVEPIEDDAECGGKEHGDGKGVFLAYLVSTNDIPKSVMTWKSDSTM